MNLAYITNGSEAMKTLTIDEGNFWNEFRSEADYHDEAPQPLYLDLNTGQIFHVSDGGDAAEASRAMRKSGPRTPYGFSKIPRFTHRDYGDMLKSFLASDWTTDDIAKARAKLAYSTSIGRWMKQVNDPNAISAFFRFRDSQLKTRVKDSLLRSGLEPVWMNCS